MIRFFKSPQPAIMIILPIIILALWIHMAGQVSRSIEMGLPLWNLFASLLANVPGWLCFTIMFMIVSGQAVYLNIILNRHEVIYKNTFIPALVFALLVSLLPDFMRVHPVHFVNLLLVIIFDRLFTLFKNEFPVSALFDTGFLSGVCALIFLPAIVLLPLLMAGLLALRPFKIKEWMITLVGFILPYFFVSTIMFWRHELPAFWTDYMSHFKSIKPSLQITLNTREVISVALCGILLFLSLARLRANYRKNIIRMRIYQQIFFIFLLLAGASVFLLKVIHLTDFLFLLIPVSVFCGYFYVSAKKRVFLYEYSLWGVIVLIIWNQMS